MTPATTPAAPDLVIRNARVTTLDAAGLRAG